MTLLINVKTKAFSQYFNFNNVCLAVEGTSSRMHLFHFMQNNLSFSHVTQSRFWIKLVVCMYLITASLLLCPLHPRSQSGCYYVKVQRFKLCGLLTISKLYLITASLYSFAGELPDPNQDAIMARCSVCSEKAYVNPCAHCDKKCCDDCKEAHCDILKREISRVNNQVKRGWHRLEDCVQQVS